MDHRIFAEDSIAVVTARGECVFAIGIVRPDRVCQVFELDIRVKVALSADFLQKYDLCLCATNSFAQLIQNVSAIGPIESLVDIIGEDTKARAHADSIYMAI